MASHARLIEGMADPVMAKRTATMTPMAAKGTLRMIPQLTGGFSCVQPFWGMKQSAMRTTARTTSTTVHGMSVARGASWQPIHQSSR